MAKDDDGSFLVMSPNLLDPRNCSSFFEEDTPVFSGVPMLTDTINQPFSGALRVPSPDCPDCPDCPGFGKKP